MSSPELEPREPNSKVEVRFGSIASRSPSPRPSSLPPILNGTVVTCHVAPRSALRKIAAGPQKYMPAAR